MAANSLTSNLFWKFSERIAAQVVTIFVTIILARLLSPEDYGVVSLVTVFITIANVFVGDGMGSALIQKKDTDALDYSSMLYFNFFLSAILYGLLFVGAPLLARFFGKGYELLVPVLRVLGLRLFPAAINTVQNAYISKKMIFRKFFLSTLVGTVVSGAVGIGMAYNGFGVWALVAQYLTNTTIGTVILCITLKKKPLLRFSFSRLRSMLKFGSRILCTNLLITCYEQFKAMVVGKVYSSQDLAFYEKGRQFPSLIEVNLNATISAVLFPKMANEQSREGAIKEITRMSIRMGAFVLAPIMLGLAAVSEEFVLLVLTEKWMPCVPLMRMFCVMYLFYPLHGANMQAIKAMGAGNTFLKLETFKKVIELIVLICVFRISVEAMVVSMTIVATLFVFVNAYPNIKLMGYSVKEQLSDFLPALLMSGAMLVIVSCVNLLGMSAAMTMVVKIVLGAAIYIGLSVLTKNKEFITIKQMCVALLKRAK